MGFAVAIRFSFGYYRVMTLRTQVVRTKSAGILLAETLCVGPFRNGRGADPYSRMSAALAGMALMTGYAGLLN